MERETWEALLSFLLAINDALLSPPTVKGNRARDRRPLALLNRLWKVLERDIVDGHPSLLNSVLNPGSLDPDPGFAESWSRLYWIRIQALLNPDSGFAEAGSRLCRIRIQALLNPDPGFAESGSRLCWIRVQSGSWTKFETERGFY